MPLPRLLTLAAAIMLALFASVAPASAQNVVVLVNGEPITNLDIEQRTKLIFLTTHKQAKRDEVLNELIDEKVKLREGKKFGVDPGSSDVEQSYTAMAQRMRLSTDQLTKSLESQGVRPETLKARLKVDMVWGSLVRGRFRESLQVSEKDVAAAVREKGEEKLEVEAFEYKMQPLVMLVAEGIAAGRLRAAQERSRAIARARGELRRGEGLFQFDGERRHARDGHQDDGRYPGSAARRARQDPDRPSDAARNNQAGRRNGGVVRTQPDQDRHAEEKGSPGQDVRGQIRGEIEGLSRGSPRKSAMIEYR